MLKAKVTAGNKKIVFIGLSFGNLAKFKEAPRDTFIRINGADMDMDHDILVFSGETEEVLETFFKDTLMKATDQ